LPNVTSTSPTVVVAIAGAELREGVCRSLEGEGFVIVGAAGDVAAAVAATEDARPDLCLVDIDLRGRGLTAVSLIATRVPSATIVVLAPNPRPAEMIAALERGASGYLAAGIGEAELVKTLRAAYAGEPALPRSFVPDLIDHVRGSSPRRAALTPAGEALTDREWEVAELVAIGLSTGEIGARLGLSPITVRRHISSLRKKSGTASRDALAEALRLFPR
jgi:DNA-binding NarL/FixJ family response regulator